MEPEEFMYMLENVKELYIIFAFARKLKIIIVIPLYLYIVSLDIIWEG